MIWHVWHQLYLRVVVLGCSLGDFSCTHSAPKHVPTFKPGVVHGQLGAGVGFEDATQDGRLFCATECPKRTATTATMDFIFLDLCSLTRQSLNSFSGSATTSFTSSGGGILTSTPFKYEDHVLLGRRTVILVTVSWGEGLALSEKVLWDECKDQTQF